MPELPETETLARDLNASVVGRTISAVDVVHADVLRGITGRDFARQARGATIRRAWRRAKAVVLDMSTGHRLVVVPRFTGGLIRRPSGNLDDAYDALRFRLDDSSTLAYRDVRRLGTVAWMDDDAFARFDRRLGQEPLDPAFTAVALSAFLRASSQPVKKVLMDQRRVAGIGNIYANEALWAAGIDPSRPARRVTAAEAESLRDALVRILEQAITARGTTFRDFRDASGNRGGYAGRLAAYGRGGEPCLRCATRLTLTHAVDGRATVFCHRCQS